MRRSLLYALSVPVVIVSLLGPLERNVQAQDYSCGSPSAYNGICYYGEVGSGYTGIQIQSTGGRGVNASDNGSAGIAVDASVSANGAAVWATSSYSGSCSNYSNECLGIYASSESGYAILALSSAYTAIAGEVNSSTYSGVSGVNSGSGNGVSGYASGGHAIYGSDTGGGTGVYGKCSGGSGCYAGYFANNVYINGTVYPPSDERLKKNIAPLSSALEQLLKLHGVTFEWREPEEHNDATGPQIGFIAQDVEKVFPGWVATNREGFKALSVSQLEGLEVESIRTLKIENDLLRERVVALESGRQPRVAGVNLNGVGFGVGGLAVGIGLVISRRRRVEEQLAK
jgi:hypothetical protein